VVQRQTFKQLQAQLAHARSGFENLETSVLPAFNGNMKGAGVAVKTGD
jgi:hypothetical protein